MMWSRIRQKLFAFDTVGDPFLRDSRHFVKIIGIADVCIDGVNTNDAVCHIVGEVTESFSASFLKFLFHLKHQKSNLFIVQQQEQTPKDEQWRRT